MLAHLEGVSVRGLSVLGVSDLEQALMSSVLI